MDSVSLEPFDGHNFDDYLDRVECYFCSKDIGVVPSSASAAQKAAVEKKMSATFITLIGKESYTVLKDLCYPDNPKDLKFKELVEKMRNHYSPKVNVAAETFRFQECSQEEGESVKDFANRLKRLAASCDFGTHLSRALRDQFVRGLRSRNLTKKLLVENKSFSQALDMAIAEEVAEANAASLGGERPAAPVNAVNRQTERRGFRPAQSQSSRRCGGCGGQWHANRQQCPAWGKACRKCGKMNHFAKHCRSQSVNNVVDSTSEEVDPASMSSGPRQVGDPAEYSLNFINKVSGQAAGNSAQSVNRVEPYVCSVEVGSTPVLFEIDTGAAVTIINEAEFAKLQKAEKLSLSTEDLPRLRSYAGRILPVRGRVTSKVSHGQRSAELSFYVVEGSGPNLLGRDSLERLALDWKSVFKVSDNSSSHILEEFPELFQPSMGTWKHGKVKLAVDRNAKPRFLKARNVPYALQRAVEVELERLEKEGIISPVSYSDWAAPIVPVLKSNGQVRICGDYKCTVNQAAKVDKYPLPEIEDLYQKLSQGRYFTKLDLSHAYQQLELDEDSKLLTTINTPKGLFVYNRLPFGIAAAPAIFQRTMEQLLAGLPCVVVYLDDIVVTGKTKAEHDFNLRRVLERLQSAGLKLNEAKCLVCQPSITFLGHVIDAEGIRPSPSKVQDLQDAPVPTNVAELRSFLGLINYYHRFLKNLSTILAPLYELLSVKVWQWSPKHQQAFEQSKALLLAEPVRVHYNPLLPIVITCDASPYGVGAVLAHAMPDGSEKPVAFASCTLSQAEKNYSQLDREALAVVFAVTRFHKYVYGRAFALQTDHKPLLGLLQADRQVPPLASSRMQRWALKLANYQYEPQYRPGKANGCADGLSRLPNPAPVPELPQPAEVVLAMSVLDSTPVTVARIAQWTSKDPVMSLVAKFLQTGWPDDIAEDLLSYHHCRDELSIMNGCVLRGARVVIPAPGHVQLLDDLHSGHPGITPMKGLARSYVWWPDIDREIGHTVKTCQDCQAEARAPNHQQVHPWEWPGKPWVRVHVDYAGPFEGKMILVIVASHSKFIDAHVTSGSTAAITIRKLRQTFAMIGLPNSIVSDNGPAFDRAEFRQFCSANGIKQTLVSPYHPASDGLAERAVQTVKCGLKKQSGPDLESRLANFLFSY